MSLSARMRPLINSSKTSVEAWNHLSRTDASSSLPRMQGLVEQLSNISCGTHSINDYFSSIHAIADELTLIGHLMPHTHLINHVLKGIGPEFKEIVVVIRARDIILSREELDDKLNEHDSFLNMRKTKQMEI